MAWQQTPYTAGYVAVALAMCIIVALVYRSRERPGARPLLVLTLLTAFWAATTAAQIARADLAWKIGFSSLTYLSITTIPVVILFFAEQYTNRDVLLTRYGPLPLLVFPALTLGIVFTNSWHNLMWTTRDLVMSGSGYVTFDVTWGPWFWAHALYSYALVAVGSYVLIKMLVVSEDVYRSQAVLILTGIFAPWVSNALFIGGLVSFPVDPTPFAFSVTAVMFFLAIYQHQLLDLMPIAREVARDEMMDNLAEGVFVLDDRGRIADVNERGENILDTTERDLIGEQLATVVPEFATVLEEDRPDDVETSTEVALRRNGTLRHYDVHITELRRGGGLLTGRLVSIRDVTERRQREQRLDVLNRALRHDLRNEANVILGYAELGMKNNPDAEWVQEIQEHVSGMIDLSTKARQIEQAIGNGNVTPQSVEMVTVVESAIEDIADERPDVAIETHLPEQASARAIEFVGAAITNALENAIEHNDNPDPLVEVSVSVRTTDEGVLVEISDNGPGIHPDEREVLLRGRETQLEHVSGLGLWIINWIVTESGGEIRFAENDPRGSVITIRLPEADDGPAGDAASAHSSAADDETDTAPESTTASGEATVATDGDEPTEADVGSAGDSSGDLSSPVEGSEFGRSS